MSEKVEMVMVREDGQSLLRWRCPVGECATWNDYSQADGWPMCKQCNTKVSGADAKALAQAGLIEERLT